MPTAVTWNGTAYSVPNAGELNWATLTNFLVDLGNNAQTTNFQKLGSRIAVSTPVAVSAVTDSIIHVDTTVIAAAVTVNLPAGASGQVFYIVDGSGAAATNNITIDANAAETINGAATYVIVSDDGGVTLGWDGTEWRIISEVIGDSLLVGSGTFSTGDVVITTGSLAVGTPTPKAPVHVFTSDTSITPDTDADEALLESVGNTGMTILSGSNSLGSLFFGDPGSAVQGRVSYEHGSLGDNLKFYSNATLAMTIDSSQNVGVGGTAPYARLNIIGADSFNDNGLGFSDATDSFRHLITVFNDGAAPTTNSGMQFQVSNTNSGGKTPVMTLRGNGNVGIKEGSPATELHCNGQAFFTGGYYIANNVDANLLDNASNGASSSTIFIGNASINVTSDIRLKEVYGPTTTNATDLLNKIELFDYSWNDPNDTSFNNRNARGTWMGFSAQQVIEHIPTMINAPRKEEDLSLDLESESSWMVDQTAAIPMLIRSIQELSARLEKLEG